ncbi:MAG: hypothetical protein HC828_07240 [Blastochloris sp.]|nr:hypothetical protein [Blastochloris sp.]
MLFYEDMPYASDPDLYQKRLGVIVGLTSLIMTFEHQFLAAKIEAFSYYRSQIPMLFDTDANMHATLTHVAQQVSGNRNVGGERYWSCSPNDVETFQNTRVPNRAETWKSCAADML